MMDARIACPQCKVLIMMQDEICPHCGCETKNRFRLTENVYTVLAKLFADQYGVEITYDLNIDGTILKKTTKKDSIAKKTK